MDKRKLCELIDAYVYRIRVVNGYLSALQSLEDGIRIYYKECSYATGFFQLSRSAFKSGIVIETEKLFVESKASYSINTLLQICESYPKLFLTELRDSFLIEDSSGKSYTESHAITVNIMDDVAKLKNQLKN